MRILGFMAAKLILVICTLIAIPYTRNAILKTSLEFYLSSEDKRIFIEQLESGLLSTTLTNTKFKIKNEQIITLDTIRLDYNLINLMRKSHNNFKIRIISNKNNDDASDDIDVELSYTSNEDWVLNISELSLKLLEEVYKSPLSGKCYGKINTNAGFASCDINSSESLIKFNTSFDFINLKLANFKSTGLVQNIPLDLHKIIYIFLDQNAVLEYLYSNVSGGTINNATWNLDIDQLYLDPAKNYVEANISNISHLIYNYSLPKIQNITANFRMNGTNMAFQNITAKSVESILSQGEVTFDIKDSDNITFDITAIANGKISDVMEFIPNTTLQNLREIDIDLLQTTGNAQTTINIKVPFSSEPFFFDIHTKITNAGLNLFQDMVSFSKGALNLTFDGKEIKIEGDILFNRFKSKLNISNFLEPLNDVYTTISLVSSIVPNEYHNKRYPLKFIAGKSKLFFDYKLKGDTSYISATSDLTKLKFSINKLGIMSEIGKKAHININGKSEKDGSLPFFIKLNGEDNITIDGNGVMSNGITKVDFKTIKAKNTNFKCNATFSKDLLHLKIRGKTIDLSQSNLEEFLTKNADNTETYLDVIMDKIILKSNTIIENYIVNIKCDKLKCYKGNMYGILPNSGVIGVNLYNTDNLEDWRLNVENAGSLLRGVGMMQNIYNGKLSLNLKINRSTVKQGEKLHIAEGKVAIENFITKNNSAALKIISITSLAGLAKFFTFQNELGFTKMLFDFTYDGDIVQISKGSAIGPYMDLTLEGNIDTTKQELKIKGTVAPSSYGIGVIKHIPIIGKVFTLTPYSIYQKY
jgi:hypothetical protein